MNRMRWTIVIVLLTIAGVVGYFQLPGALDFRPLVASVLNVPPDELPPGPTENTVDFVELFDERFEHPVPADQNIVVTMAALIPRQNFHPDWWREFYEALGAPMPQDVQQRWIPDVPVERRARPWTVKEDPELAEVYRQAKPLLDRLASDALSRRGYYHPLITIDSPALFASLLPVAQEFRPSSRALLGRAMLRAGEGDLDGAIHDLAAARRLGESILSGSSVVEMLMGLAIMDEVQTAEWTLMNHCSLDPDQLRAMQRAIEQTSEPQSATIALQNELMITLDLIQAVGLNDPEALPMVVSFAGDDSWAARSMAKGSRLVDWTTAAELTAEKYQQLIDAASKGPEWERLQRIQNLRNGGAAEGATNPSWLRMLAGARSRGQLAAEALNLGTPAWTGRYAVRRASIMQRDRLLLAAIAARRFRLVHGRWPNTIDQLIPDYLSTQPVDLLTGGPIRLKVESEQILVVECVQEVPVGLLPERSSMGDRLDTTGQFDDRVLRAVWPSSK